MTTRILCVEDNPQNMRLVRKILRHAGYEVLEAENGLTGVEVATNEKPDLILMDINLPDIDGLEATNRIKAKDPLKSIPIVALTANAMYGDEERILAAGCDGYLAKPVSKSKLLDVITLYLSKTDDTHALPSATDLPVASGISPETVLPPVKESSAAEDRPAATDRSSFDTTAQ